MRAVRTALRSWLGVVTAYRQSILRTGSSSSNLSSMAARKQFQSRLTVSPTLSKVLEEARNRDVSEDELREQRVSFAFGNALKSDLITKDSVRRSSQSIRLKR
jgi:hypothetical protein